MEEAAKLANYLPLSFKTPKEQEYIEFLWDAFETNYTHGKYQFAFLAYHMLTMSFVYFNIWQIKQTEPSDFKKGLIGFAKNEKALLEATSPFSFSIVPERTILRFLKLIACDNGKIGTYAKLVDDRNDSAHTTLHPDAEVELNQVHIHSLGTNSRNARQLNFPSPGIHHGTDCCSYPCRRRRIHCPQSRDRHHHPR